MGSMFIVTPPQKRYKERELPHKTGELPDRYTDAPQLGYNQVNLVNKN
jgi:hypothetical protein